MTGSGDMNLAQALHTAARRYCNDQYEHWTTRYAKIIRAGCDRTANDYDYTPEALDVFPRYKPIEAAMITACMVLSALHRRRWTD